MSADEHPVQGTTEELAELHAERANTSLGFGLLVESGDYSSELILRDGVFEIPETDLVTRLVRPGDTCIDGGCHLGYYTCLMAKLAGPKGCVYAFDANPWCCQRTERNLALNVLGSAEVIHAALGDERGTTSFHVSTDDQTGLSSLGPIEHQKEVISVPWLRLEDFLKPRGVQRIRLLKLDVEGAEKIALLGLGKLLTDHRVDFVLLECYDERLQLLGCTTQDVAKLLEHAGYVPWEYGRENPSGWSRASRVQSRGDCNYLFASPLVGEPVSKISLAGALDTARTQRDQLRKEIVTLRRDLNSADAEISRHLEEKRQREKEIGKFESDLEWLNRAAEESRRELALLHGEKHELEVFRHAVENSKGWRLLNVYRKIRDSVLQVFGRNDS